MRILLITPGYWGPFDARLESPVARIFGGVVACSRNVTRDLVVKDIPQGKIKEIPIPFPCIQNRGKVLLYARILD